MASCPVFHSRYDDSGQLKTKTDSAGTTTYDYDQADRLISVLAPAGSALPNETFTYDPAGNQTQSGQTYDSANRLLSDAKYDYTYDNEGNQTSRTERATGKVTTYAWNALHQMTSAHLPDGSVVSYRYDALGRRVEQATSSGTTRYVNLGANVVAEYDGANILQASYVTTLGSGDLPGAPLEATVGTATTYPLLDGVGSVTGTTDSAGTVTTFSYTAYGSPVGASSGTYAYGTYGYDSATGLYYARARYYDPAIGRFLSEDPVAAPNNYPYGTDDPVLRGDPTGQMPMVERAWQTFVTFSERMWTDYVPGPALPTKMAFPWGTSLGYGIAGLIIIVAILVDAAMTGGQQKAPPAPPAPTPPSPKPPAPRPPLPTAAG